MKQGIGTSYFASSSIPWMADHGYNFMQPFYSSDSSRMIIFAPAICRTFMQFPSACAKIELSYFPKKVFLHIFPPGFLSFLLENPLSIVIGLVGFQVGFHPKHTVEFSQFPVHPAVAPQPPLALGVPLMTSQAPAEPVQILPRRCGSSHFLNGKPWVFLIYVSLP